ncbi:MAG: transposase [Chloroflexota bacterium]|nr:transposase [Chloroflexota bacterium]MDE2885018.1 transposase [Chloroflexota bacterium]
MCASRLRLIDTGDVLMARLRKGRANTARGAAHFLHETIARVRHAGTSGQLTIRADSGFYNHAIVSACRNKQFCFSITIRMHPRIRSLIEAIPEDDWAPIPWKDGAAEVAETTYTVLAFPSDRRGAACPLRRAPLAQEQEEPWRWESASPADSCTRRRARES